MAKNISEIIEAMAAAMAGEMASKMAAAKWKENHGEMENENNRKKIEEMA
jgi:hypothetical protein